jgi:DNA-binding CsgD family transcriptional regulator
VELNRAYRRRPREAARAELSPQVLSDLIGGIYDCALRPAGWVGMLSAINRELSFSSSALGVHPLRSGVPAVGAHAGMDAEWLSIGDKYVRDVEELWGGVTRIQQYPLDEPVVASHLPTYSQRHSNRYYQEILEPRGVVDATLVAVAREPRLLGYLAFNRHRSIGTVGEREAGAIRLLAPHFRRAVTISNLFDLKTVEVATFTSALDALAFGVVLVDEALRIVHANRAAEAAFAEGDPVNLVRGTLRLSGASSQAALARAVTLAAKDEVTLGHRGIGIPAARRSGEPAVVHVLPLKGPLRAGLVQRAVAALFIAEPGDNPALPINALTLFYDLTPAEAGVFKLICAGRKLTDIALALGISRGTAKTHLLHIFQKTGCTRQLDLVLLATSLSLPL